MKAKKSSLPTDDTSQLTALQDKLVTTEENWRRALADYQNLLRRVDSDKREFTKMSNANLIARLLPSLDIIELAAGHSGDLGVQMAAKQFAEALNQEGLQVIGPKVGDIFDPLQHECTETIENPGDRAKDSIVEVVLKGYRIGDYVLRPARVKVST